MSENETKKNSVRNLRFRSVSHTVFVPINVVLSNQFIHDLKLLSSVYKALVTKKRFKLHIPLILFLLIVFK
jgi:hypothetical protein